MLGNKGALSFISPILLPGSPPCPSGREVEIGLLTGRDPPLAPRGMAEQSRALLQALGCVADDHAVQKLMAVLAHFKKVDVRPTNVRPISPQSAEVARKRTASQRSPSPPSPFPSQSGTGSGSEETLVSESLDSDAASESTDLSNFAPALSKSQRRKRKKRAAEAVVGTAAPSGSAELMAVDAAASTSGKQDVGAKTPSPPTPSAPVRPSGSAKPHTRCDPQPAAAKAPPPVFLRDKSLWHQVSTWCKQEAIHYTQATNVGEAIKIITPTIDAFRALTRLLTLRKAPYHTYALPSERKVKAVLKGVPFELQNEEITADLKEQGFPVEVTHKLYNKHGVLYPVCLVVLTNGPQARDIFKKRELTVCGLSGIKVVPPNARGIPGQCHRCQLYGHAAANCSAPPRCVKCLVPHHTKECTRTRDAPTLPGCVLCGQYGHPANYRGCPRAPKPNSARNKPKPNKSGKKKKAKKSASRVSKPAPPAPTLANFPALPTRAEQTPIPPKPVWGPPRAEQPSQAAPPPAPPKSSPRPAAAAPRGGGDLKLVYDTIKAIDLREISVLAAKLRRASSPQERLLALCEHEALLNAL